MVQGTDSMIASERLLYVLAAELRCTCKGFEPRTVLTTELSSRRRRVLTGDVTGLPAGTHNHEGGGGGGFTYND